MFREISIFLKQHAQSTLFKASLLVVIVAVVLSTVFTVTTVVKNTENKRRLQSNASETAPLTAADFLQQNGKDLIYRGTKVILKGTNFDNIRALGANIGSGSVSSINYSETDYIELSKHGANHARFGLSFNWYQKDKTSFFQKLDEQIGYAKRNKLWIVWNMFTTPGNCYEGYGNHCGFWQSASEQQQLQDFWVEMANRYKNEPVVAGYDILNEPTPNNDCKQWFPIAGRIRNAIFQVSPNQLVFIETCSDPGNDLAYNNPPLGKNIVYEVHDYSLMGYSHNFSDQKLANDQSQRYPGYGKDWFGECYMDKATFSGQPKAGDPSGCSMMDIRQRYGINWAAQKNVPIYIGEWGATSKAIGNVQYTKDKAELYNAWGVSHAHYTWKHQTIVTGGHYQWGIYADSNPPRLDDPAKLEAVKVSWAGSVRPDFGAYSSPIQTTVPSTTAPTKTPTATPLASATPKPTVGASSAPTPSPTKVPTITSIPTNSLGIFKTNADIGAPAFSGSTIASNGAYSIRGGGTDVWSTSDQFQYAFSTISGDVTITARVTGITNTHDWAKAGVMIRESTSAGAKHAMSVMTPGGGSALQYRHTAADVTYSLTPVAGIAPRWVRLVRTGNVFQGFYSTDGAKWTSMGSKTVTMPSQVLVGLFVTAHDNTKIATGTFDNVTIQTGLATVTSTPVATPTPAAKSLYRAINVNGPSLTANGVTYEAGKTATNVTYERAWYFDNQTVTLNPPVSDANLAKMIRSSAYYVDSTGNGVKMKIANIPSGSYEVYIYNWEDNNTENFGLYLNGTFTGNYSSGTKGSWKKLGPYKPSITNGTLTIETKGGAANISGIEIYKL